MNFRRIDCSFSSRGQRCSGWLYLPEGIANAPVIVMAHGFACEKEFRLPAFAERFAGEGMAVFLFDYRCSGQSEGQPRNLVSYSHQLQDWEAAIAYVHTIPDVDANKMALWGTSYSGGHVISIAGRHPELLAVSAHVPFADGLTSIKTMGLSDMFKATGAGILDLFYMIFRSSYNIPVVAKPGQLACMNSPGSYEGYLSIVPEGSGWVNGFPARACLRASFYRPTAAANRVKCPVLIIMGDEDKVIYPPSVREMAAAIDDCELVAMPMGHFDSYNGELFEKVINIQANFLRKKLLIEGDQR